MLLTVKRILLYNNSREIPPGYLFFVKGMDFMKKLLCLSLALLLLLCGCENGNNPSPTPEPTPEPQPQVTELSDVTYELHTLEEEGISLATLGTEPHAVTSAVTWVANELVLNAANTYSKPFYDVDVDLILTNGAVTYTIPGFWDGDNVWRVRFVCPTAGDWTYETVCTDTSDTGLHGIKGALTCTEYNGNLDVYKHGFVQTTPDKRYFTYADGTPFFYLGDTHWSLGGEKADMVKKMTDQRVKQGFTVIQSEPLDGRFALENGINKYDIKGLSTFDELFQIIASHGLTHANAEFFFPSSMSSLISYAGGYDKTKPVGAMTAEGKNYTFYDLADSTKDELKRISRLWVARYAAYPVLWTLGQEIDNDFYWENNPDGQWSKVNNPYKYVAQYINELDPYKHPLTGHMEGAGVTVASSSAFRDVSAHTWWAVQWSQTYNTSINITPPADFYVNGQGKPAVLYESRYCYLWTKNFGARMQGYMAFLSGMCGYGWGGQDTWSYKNIFNEDEDSFDGVDTITSSEKEKATYDDSLEYISSYQVGYMRAFLEQIVGNWYDLVPRFGSSIFLARESGTFGIISSLADSSKGVCYFYQTANQDLMEKPNAADNETAAHTGTLGSLKPDAEYGYIWFDPVDGKTIENGTFRTGADGKHEIGPKIDKDMVYYFYLIQ